MLTSPKTEEILYLSFNQNQELFVCGTTRGFKVYRTSPLEETHSKDLGGGIGIVEMLYKTNVLALVGGGPNPLFPLNKVIIWDDHRTEAIGEMSFKSEVKAVRLTLKKVVVIIETKIYIHHLIDLKLMDSIDTAYNPRGLCCFSLKEDLLCCPDQEVGQFKIKFYEKDIQAADGTNTKSIAKKAHSTALFYMELNSTADKLATASEKGTLIRVHSTKDGSLLQELRRGTENHQILSISFNPTSDWIACTSDTGTVHIFRVAASAGGESPAGDKEDKVEVKNKTSKLAFMKVFHHYFGSEWSYSHLKKISEKKTKVIFGPEEKQIIVIGYDGKYHCVAFESKENGGNKILQTSEFFKPVDIN